MQTLKGKEISLRALEPEDLDFLYNIENDETFWEISQTNAPFSKYQLKLYIENAHLDIYQAKQLRLIVQENSSKNQVGIIDLFDVDAKNLKAGVGILIDYNYQQKGFAKEALSLLIDYVFNVLNLHQLYANITTDNTKSINLFEGHNFKKVGIKKDWMYTNNQFKDEILYQLINN